jgi:hypothetical protein
MMLRRIEVNKDLKSARTKPAVEGLVDEVEVHRLFGGCLPALKQSRQFLSQSTEATWWTKEGKCKNH